jgi:hypothetical protein
MRMLLLWLSGAWSAVGVFRNRRLHEAVVALNKLDFDWMPENVHEDTGFMQMQHCDPSPPYLPDQ